MNTEPKQLGSLYLSHSYRIRKVGVIKVAHYDFGWDCLYSIPIIISLSSLCQYGQMRWHTWGHVSLAEGWYTNFIMQCIPCITQQHDHLRRVQFWDTVVQHDPAQLVSVNEVAVDSWYKLRFWVVICWDKAPIVSAYNIRKALQGLVKLHPWIRLKFT